MSGRSKLRGTLLAAGAVAVLAGCGGDSSDGDAPAGGVADALAAVSAPGDGDPYFSWVDVAALREAADLPDSTQRALEDPRWATPVGLAVGDELTLFGFDAGFDPLAGDRTIEVGLPPDAAARYDGVDSEAARSAFEDFGFKEEGDFLALGDEGEIVSSAVDDFGAGPVGTNRVATDGDSVAFGSYEEPVTGALDPGSDPLIDEPGFAAAADCLGSDVFAATIAGPAGGVSGEVALIGVGVASPSAGDAVPEVVCAAGTPNGSADEVAGCMESAFNDGGVSPVTQQTYEDLLGSAEVERGEVDGTPWARATFSDPPGERVGTVFQMLEDGSLAIALGAGDPASALGSGATPAQAEDLQGSPAGCGSA